MPEQEYEASEIKQWKSLIYGQSWTNDKVEEWVSHAQSPKQRPHKYKAKKQQNKSDISDDSQSSLNNEWLSSPITTKRNYRLSGSPAVKKQGSISSIPSGKHEEWLSPTDYKPKRNRLLKKPPQVPLY